MISEIYRAYTAQKYGGSPILASMARDTKPTGAAAGRKGMPVDEARALEIPPEVVESAVQSLGAFFEPIARLDPQTNARDFLDTARSFKRARILERYTPMESKKLLEIGSGFGTNLAVWIKYFGVDGHGVEPAEIGFDQGFVGSQKLLPANGIDAHRIQNACGESLPFPDKSFDIVYSANVLEHTADPPRVLAEAVRVLRNGGVLHMEMPNFLSYYEGHYNVLQPPLVWKPMLPLWVKWVFRRDPAFARTLHTEINPPWCRRMVRKLNASGPVQLVSLGQELFLERLKEAFQFESQGVAGKIGGVITVVQKVNLGNWMGRLIVALQGHYPIYLTLRKL
jgi:ubiquinone/menaquinone biosynthesis C-methylase UbiE